MSYEIPQQLEYKEKIIFGLTFGQLLYALIFSPLALAILFKTNFEIYTRIGLALIPCMIAGVFMFTDIPKQVLRVIKWFGWREIDYLDKHSLPNPKMQKYLPIKEINQYIHLTDKQIAILKVEPINFSLRNNEEKQIVISTFQKFLNSLDFSVQIVIATDTLNLDQYLAKLEEKTAELNKIHYRKLFSDFKEHLANLINNDHLLDRSFYLVIPEKDNLPVQLQVCEALLNNMNLKFSRVEEENLTTLLSSFFHNLYEEDTAIIKDQKNYLYYAIAPQKITTTATEFKIDNQFCRTVAVKGYPRTVEEGFLDKIITINGNFDIAIHIEPYDLEFMMVMLNKELQKQRGDLWSMNNKGIINPILEIKYQDTRMVLENLQKGNEKLFNVSLYITCKASTIEELNLLSRKMEAELNALLMIPHKPAYEQHKAFKSVLPLGIDELKIKRNVTTKALSAFFPFTSQFLQVDETGILLGLNKNNIPIIKDIFKLYNANGVVLASSGGGKSYFTKLMISRLLLNGTKVMVIDPQAEYVDLVRKFDGQIVTISKNSATIINPLDLMGHDYDEKKLTLLELFPIMLGQTSEIQRAVLDRALTTTYGDKGITNDKSTWRKKPPIMEDLLKQLKSMSKNATKIESETYRSLINRIEMYSSGVFSFLNKQTNLNFNNQFVCFNIGEMPNQVKPVIMFLILDYVYMKMKKDIERKILVIDEAWSLLERTEDEGYVFKIVKTARKFNLGLLLITQDVADLLRNDAGKALLNNSEYTLLLRQKPSIIEQVQKTFHLSTLERDRLLTATTGEGIIIISNDHSEIKIIASPEEHAVITTNADERLAKEIKDANEVVTVFEEPTLDFEKGWFRKKELTKEQIEELLKRDYRLSLHIGLEGGRRQEFLLKPRSNESCEHFFVIKIIEEYLKKFTDKIELLETKDADIIFEAGKKIAIEVETGSRHISRVTEKVNLLNKNYSDWFFVVTNVKRDKEKYQKLGRTYARREIPALIQSYFLNSGSAEKSQKSQNSKSDVLEADKRKNSRSGVQKSCHINRGDSKRLNSDKGRRKKR